MTQRRDSVNFSFPVKGATFIPVGAMAAIDATGHLVNAAAVAAHRVVGVAEADIDNSAGIDAALNGPVKRGCWKFGNSASADLIARADVGQPCYVVDNQTVAKTSNSNARPVAGVIRDVETDGVWVEI
jgi:hypothetical protein